MENETKNELKTNEAGVNHNLIFNINSLSFITTDKDGFVTDFGLIKGSWVYPVTNNYETSCEAIPFYTPFGNFIYYKHKVKFRFTQLGMNRYCAFIDNKLFGTQTGMYYQTDLKKSPFGLLQTPELEYEKSIPLQCAVGFVFNSFFVQRN